MLRRSTTVKLQKLILILGACLGLTLAACSAAAVTEEPATAAPIVPTAASVTLAAPTQAGPTLGAITPTEPASSAAEGQLRLVLAPEGNEARYRVREQLVNLSLPSDAVGVTSAVTGVIVMNPDGTIVRDESKFVVDLTTLKSDQSRRDNFIRNNTLQTNQYPTAEFVPTEARGLPSPLPTSGSVTFQLVGDMTVRGVTRPTTWDVTAQIVDGRELMGSATTSFTFADFGMTAPRVPVVLSVEETIGLELDFRLLLDTSASS